MCLALGAPEALVVFGELVRQDLDLHGTAELGVLGPLDEAHPPLPDLHDEAVAGDPLPSSRSRRWRPLRGPVQCPCRVRGEVERGDLRSRTGA